MATKKTTKKAAKGTIKIKWVKSAIACPQMHKKVIKGLGFTKLNQVVERPDNEGIRGMVAKVPHLVAIQE